MDVILDDRLLIEELLVGLDRRGARLHTTSYWYYRACRAATAAGGHLSGPFRHVPDLDQQRAIASMLRLPPAIGLPEPRHVVPLMVDVAGRHPRLNLLNLEAVATARVLGATIWLSPEAAAGILPDVLRAEQVTWEVVAPS